MINDVRFYAFDRSLNRFFCNLWSLFHWFFGFLDYMLVDEQNALCVRKCPENYYPVNNTCVPCDGACPKCKSAWARYHVNQPRCIDAIFTVLHLSIENVTLTSWRCRQVLANSPDLGMRASLSSVLEVFEQRISILCQHLLGFTSSSTVFEKDSWL